MGKVKSGQIWRCLRFPKRNIKVLRNYERGWMVQGIENGLEIGSEYPIGIETIENNWSRSNFLFFTLRKLIKIRVRLQFYYST